MAKPGTSIRIRRFLAAALSPRGDALVLLFALTALLSVISRHSSSALAASSPSSSFHSDELILPEEEDEGFEEVDEFLRASPSLTVSRSSSPESHHGPPPSSPVSSEPPPKQEPKLSAALEEWDDEEFEGVPIPAVLPQSEPESAPELEITLPSSPAPKATLASVLRTYSIEIACVAFLICFAINYFTGKRQNERIALSWASKFAANDSIFEKNFSLLGIGEGNDTPLLLKEGQDMFKFYASGRRYCQGLLATMELQSRHDLIARIVNLVIPKKDTVSIEVVMNDDAMDHVVLAVARKKLAKTMQKEERDLQRYARVVVATAPAGRKWISEDLMVITESKEIAGDLLTDAVIDQVFSEKSFEKFGKWFISLHFTDQQSGTSCKKVLKFTFALPDANNMADMTRLIALVPYFVDLVGRYKPSSHVRAKTEAARVKAAQEAYKRYQSVRQEELQKKKAEKRKLLEEGESKLSAEALRKKEEKERARQMKKSMPKVKMLRS